MSELTTRHRHDSIGAEPLACVTAQTRETALARLSANLNEDNAAIGRVRAVGFQEAHCCARGFDSFLFNPIGGSGSTGVSAN